MHGQQDSRLKRISAQKGTIHVVRAIDGNSGAGLSHMPQEQLAYNTSTSTSAPQGCNHGNAGHKTSFEARVMLCDFNINAMLCCVTRAHARGPMVEKGNF